MHFWTLLATAVATRPLVVSATGNLGWALGDMKADGSCKMTSDYADDFTALKSTGSKLVRTYQSYGCNTSTAIIPAAKDAGFKVLLGIWPDTTESYNNDISALQASVPGNEDVLFGITVGSEGLYRGSYTAEGLLRQIQAVQKMFPSVTIGTADTWTNFANGTADPLIRGGVKLLLCNGFSYWQGQDVNNATATYFDNMMQAIGHIQDVAGSVDAVHIMNGETGWPTDGGTNYEAAKASTQNAASYWKSAVCGMLDWGVDLFYFEAFDEPAKQDSIGQDGSAQDEKHWGAFTSDRTPKFDLG